MRNAACEELSDMIKVYTEEIVQQHLSAVCLAVSSLMQDREKKVRKAAVKAVEVILDNVSRYYFNLLETLSIPHNVLSDS